MVALCCCDALVLLLPLGAEHWCDCGDAIGKGLSKGALSRMHKVAKKQSTAVFAAAAVDVDRLPAKMGPGCFRPGVLPAELANAIADAAVATAEVIAKAPTPALPAPVPEETEEPEEPNESTEAETANQPYSHARRLPNINVAGKPIALETMIRDKVAQQGGGGGHQLRKMFRVFDKDGTGKITAEEMDAFLRHHNIKINKESLSRFFEMWATEQTAAHMRIQGTEDDDRSSVRALELIAKRGCPRVVAELC